MAKKLNSAKENDDMVKKGLRLDPQLYNYIVNSFHRSRDYIKERELPKIWRQAAKLYENEPWKGLRINRAANLSKVRIAIASDIIETGLPIATARPPMPDVNPEIDVASEEYKQYKSIVTLIGLIAKAKKGEELTEEEMAQAEEAKQFIPPNISLDNLATAEPEELEAVAKDIFQSYKDIVTGYAQKIQKELIKDWKESRMQSYGKQGYRENTKTGNFVLKSTWDSKKQRMINIACDIRTIFPTPGVYTIKGHTDDPFIYAPIMSVEKVRRTYNIEEIDEDAIGDYDEKGLFSYNATQGWMADIKATLKTAVEKLTSKDGEKSSGSCVVLECYMPDNKSTTEYYDNEYNEDGTKRLDDAGNEIKAKKSRQKFASGYKIVTIVEGHQDWILDERENLYKDGLPPFPEMRNCEQANDFYGVSDIYMVSDLIYRININASNIQDNSDLTGNPILMELKGAKAEPEKPLTNQIGQRVLVNSIDALKYVSPPAFGYDLKWWADYLQQWIDRITHLSDALRGINQYSQDSGKKIRELKMAAQGTFQPKLEAQVQFSKDWFEHVAYIHQNLDKRTYLQKEEDEMGESNFIEFIPSEGRNIKLDIDVSAESILPTDPYSNWEDALQLYNTPLKRTGLPGISIEQLIDAAPSLEDKQRAKAYVSREEDKDVAMKQFEKMQVQREQAMKAFAQIVEQLTAIATAQGIDSPEIDKLFVPALEILTQFPEIISSDQFRGLPEELKKAMLIGLAEGMKTEQPTQ